MFAEIDYFAMIVVLCSSETSPFLWLSLRKNPSVCSRYFLLHLLANDNASLADALQAIDKSYYVADPYRVTGLLELSS